MGRVIIGLLVVGVGFLAVRYANWIVANFGSMAWAEKHLGIGGSRLGWRLIGIGIILVGFLVTTNMATALVWLVFGRLFRGLQGA